MKKQNFNAERLEAMYPRFGYDNDWNKIIEYRYKAYDKHNNERNYTIEKPKIGILKESENIISSNDDFINGYKVVRLDNGEYAYVSKKENLLLPYRYDVAFNFNDLGYAMVGKNGEVDWINKKFEYLNRNSKTMKKTNTNEEISDSGYDMIEEFSESDLPLSRVIYYDDNEDKIVSYLKENGTIQHFGMFDGEHVYDDNLRIDEFHNGTKFDKSGHATDGTDILFSSGYYVTAKDIIKICKNNNYIKSISKKVDNVYKAKTK